MDFIYFLEQSVNEAEATVLKSREVFEIVEEGIENRFLTRSLISDAMNCIASLSSSASDLETAAIICEDTEEISDDTYYLCESVRRKMYSLSQNMIFALSKYFGGKDDLENPKNQV